jgi:hypothetical protein
MMKLRLQQGVALAIVLWFLAGMCLLVSGITYLARTDTQMTQLHRDRAAAVAAGDGAILLMLAGFASRDTGQAASERPLQGEFRVGPHSVSVVMVPTAGLVNVNSAPAALLARLFSGTGAVSAGDAGALAERVVLWREAGDPALPPGSGGRFRSPEDLLQVEGMTRSLWDALRDHVAAQGGAAAEPPAALEPVSATRGEPGLGLGPAAAEFAVDGNARSFRMDAFVSTGGRIWLRRSWANVGSVPNSPLPWRLSRVEAPRVVGVEGSG